MPHAPSRTDRLLKGGLLPAPATVALLPLLAVGSLLYGGVMWLRNLCYDLGLKRSRAFPLPVICVGNLSVGGTGKTPHVEHILRLLADRGLRAAMLSRGYGRRSRGFREVTPGSTADEVGDEPLQICRNCPKATVAVCEDRCHGIDELLRRHPGGIDVIVLDDAYQHRRVKAGLYVMLTTAHRPFTTDYVMPLGRLREPRGGAGRADVIVVTKCETADDFARRLPLRDGQRLFHSAVSYGSPYPLMGYEGPGCGLRAPMFECGGNVLLVTGIADPAPLLRYVRDVCAPGVVEHVAFPDHHSFGEADCRRIREAYNRLKGRGGPASILVTQKDAARLRTSRLGSDLLDVADVIPVTLRFENEPTDQTFDNTIIDYVDKNKSNRTMD